MPYLVANPTQLGSISGVAGGSAASIAAATLTDTCRIGKKTKVRDGMGGRTEAWQEVASDVPCRLYQETNPKEGQQGGALSAIGNWRLDVPIDTELGIDYQVDKDGLLYEVTDTNKGQTNAQLLTAYLMRLRAEKIEW